MQKDVVQREDVHLIAVQMNIGSRNTKRSFTTRSTLLPRQTSYLLIRAAAFSPPLPVKLRRLMSADVKAEIDFLPEDLPNHARSHIKREDQTLTNLDQAKSVALKEKEPLQSVYLKNVNQYLKVQKNAN